MSSIVLTPTDYYTAQFYAWEYRGRGLACFPEPVDIEPQFIPFFGHVLPDSTRIDDGVRARFFPGLVNEVSKLLGTEKTPANSLTEDEAIAHLEETYPTNAFNAEERSPITELSLLFPNDTRVGLAYIEELLLLIAQGNEQFTFEIVGTCDAITVQFACQATSASQLKRYIAEYLPDIVVQEHSHSIVQSAELMNDHFCMTELANSEEFTRPLRMYDRFEPDPYAGLFSALSNLEKDECAVFQVMFKNLYNPWGESILWSVLDSKGGSFFEGDQSMLNLAKEKVSKPLLVAAPRVVVFSHDEDRAWGLTKDIIHSLAPLERHGSNGFHPFIPQGYDQDDLRKDVVARQTRRTGIILNVAELATLIHIPDSTIQSPKLRTTGGKTKPLPETVKGNDFVLGTNEHLGVFNPATLSVQQRLRHMHVIGATGTGKSNFLLHSISNDFALGNGLCVLDPHGDLVDKAIQQLPDGRFKDVIVIDPSDEDFPVGLNLLDAKSEAERIILSSDLVALFRRFATSWGDQMTSVLANAINAFLNREEKGTLIELKRFLTEKKFREGILQSVSDPSITYYWKHEFPLLRSNSIASILTRLDTFLRSPLVRNMMAQRKGLDFHDIINSKKILLVKLSQGLIGEENSYLLGSIIIAKLHQAALHRQAMKEDERTPFFLYVDEFQHFITPSMSAILSGARKYGLGLVLAHQDMEQVRVVDRELANSLLANPATRVAFRCGEQDAKVIAQGLSHFDEGDIQNLGIGNAIARVERKDYDFNLSTPLVEVGSLEEKSIAVIDWTRKTYAGIRDEIEKELFEQYGKVLNIQKVEQKPEPAPPPPAHIEIIEDVPESSDKEEVVVSELEAQKLKQQDKEHRRLREHRSIQDLLKRTGEKFGFISTIEDPTSDGKGMIDVTLKRDDAWIAIEVAVTNSVGYELKNIQKCLNAGFNQVIVCSKNEDHLRAIQSESREAKQQGVQFLSLDAVIETLQGLVVPQENDEKVKGYRVNLNLSTSVSEHNSQTQKSISRTILKVIQKKKK